MKINLNVPLCSPEGDIVDEGNGGVMLRTIAANNLVNTVQGKAAEQMLVDFDLATRIAKFYKEPENSNQEIELTKDECKMILEAVQKGGSTLAYGQFYYLFKE